MSSTPKSERNEICGAALKKAGISSPVYFLFYLAVFRKKSIVAAAIRCRAQRIAQLETNALNTIQKPFQFCVVVASDCLRCSLLFLAFSYKASAQFA